MSRTKTRDQWPFTHFAVAIALIVAAFALFPSLSDAREPTDVEKKAFETKVIECAEKTIQMVQCPPLSRPVSPNTPDLTPVEVQALNCRRYCIQQCIMVFAPEMEAILAEPEGKTSQKPSVTDRANKP